MRIIQIMILFLLVACQNIEKRNSGTQVQINDHDKNLTQLIYCTINLPALQQYFKIQETLKQNELVLLDNDCIKGIGDLKKFNLPVKRLNNKEIQDQGIKAYLDYKKIKISNDTAFVYYRYDVQ